LPTRRKLIDVCAAPTGLDWFPKPSHRSGFAYARLHGATPAREARAGDPGGLTCCRAYGALTFQTSNFIAKLECVAMAEIAKMFVPPLRGSTGFQAYPPLRLRWRSPSRRHPSSRSASRGPRWANLLSRLRRSIPVVLISHPHVKKKIVHVSRASGVPLLSIFICFPSEV
jgi:hypothetical protein